MGNLQDVIPAIRIHVHHPAQKRAVGVALRVECFTGIIAILLLELRSRIPVGPRHQIEPAVAVHIPDGGSLRHEPPREDGPLVGSLLRAADLGSGEEGNEREGEEQAE